MSPRERPGSPRTRLFLALDLPEPQRARLARWCDSELGAEELRPVAEDQLHVTLVFLGWQSEEDVERIGDLAFGAIAGLPAPELLPAGVVPVPRRGARLFALDLEDPDGGAAAAQGALASALEDAGLHEPERRAFWPHVTLARVRRGRRAPRLEAGAPPLGPFRASVVTLYRSTLRPQGALYEPLARHTLG